MSKPCKLQMFLIQLFSSVSAHGEIAYYTFRTEDTMRIDFQV